MIIEYRYGSNPSVVKRTYKDVKYVRRDTGNTVLLSGIRSGKPGKPSLEEYFIAAIHLGTGEYLEGIDGIKL